MPSTPVEPATEVAASAGERDDTDAAAKRRATGERRMVPWIVSIVLILTVGLAAAALAEINSAKAFSIPGLRGLTLTQATDIAKGQGLEVTVASNRAAADPKGTVIDQSPAAGDFSVGRRISLVVSVGPAPVAVPTVVGTTWSAAKAALDGAGLIYATNPPFAHDPKVPAGDVLSVTPPAGVAVACPTRR